MDIKYINFTDNTKLDNKFLCKYRPLDRALEELEGRKLWFANPETWTDPYESYFLNNSFNDHDCVLKNRVWATCFTTRGRSEAQWKAYTDKELALMLELDGAEFIDEVAKSVGDDATIYVGKVQYVPTGRIQKSKCWEILGITQAEAARLSEEELSVRLMLIKRLPFQYENEIRLFIVFKDVLDEKKVKGGYVNNVLENQIINKVTISPNAKENTRRILRDYLKGRGYKVSCHLLYDNVTNQVIELP